MAFDLPYKRRGCSCLIVINTPFFLGGGETGQDAIKNFDTFTYNLARMVDFSMDFRSYLRSKTPSVRGFLRTLTPRAHIVLPFLHERDPPGLKARISYANRLRQYRDVSPRTMAFVNWWKEGCSAMLRATPFMKKKKKMAKEVQIPDDEISSRYEKIHGNNGLCHNLIRRNFSMPWLN